MKNQLLVAVAAGLALVSAHPPESEDSGSGAIEARSGYPPCSRTVTDRCIQLYERGVRTSANLARNATPPIVDSEDEDIDVAYAGDARHPARAGHNPAHSVAHHPVPHHPGEARAAHPARVHVAHVAAPRVYPACGAGVSDRCTQQRHPGPRRAANPHRSRQLAMRVRRAGERG